MATKARATVKASKRKAEPRDPMEATWWILGEVAGDTLLSVIQSIGWVLSQGSHSRADGSLTRERPDARTTAELGEVLVYCAERIQDEGI